MHGPCAGFLLWIDIHLYWNCLCVGVVINRWWYFVFMLFTLHLSMNSCFCCLQVPNNYLSVRLTTQSKVLILKYARNLTQVRDSSRNQYSCESHLPQEDISLKKTDQVAHRTGHVLGNTLVFKSVVRIRLSKNYACAVWSIWLSLLGQGSLAMSIVEKNWIYHCVLNRTIPVNIQPVHIYLLLWGQLAA